MQQPTEQLRTMLCRCAADDVTFLGVMMHLSCITYTQKHNNNSSSSSASLTHAQLKDRKEDVPNDSPNGLRVLRVLHLDLQLQEQQQQQHQHKLLSVYPNCFS
jgi:hypothetical protein